VGGSQHFFHNCISQITRKTIKDRVFGEDDGLGVASIHDFNLKQAFLNEFIHLNIFRSELIIHGVDPASISKFLFHVLENDNDVDDCHHIIVEDTFPLVIDVFDDILLCVKLHFL
jgi:hypothetical protein